MTVQELINELEKFPKDAEIYRYNESTSHYVSDSIEFIDMIYENSAGEIIID